MKERVLIKSEAAASTSTRAVAYKISISQPVVRSIVDHYRVERVHYLQTNRYSRREDFEHWMLGRKNNDPRFSALLLFSDEAKFSREGNFQNVQSTRNRQSDLHNPS
ncbi:hypothetical protein TNCV_4790211 [Trichonephila clavipes]|nr:hypothetical protein TNCV_4790211 [Trichonephila clavipes]